MNDIRDWFKHLIATNYFFTRVENSKEISDPIVSAIEKKVIPTTDPDKISSPIVNALEDVISAIEEKEGVEEVTVKNISDAKADFTEVIRVLTDILNKEEREIEFPEQRDVVIDLKPIIESLKSIEKRIPTIKPVELIDYTNSLKEIVLAIDKDKTGLLAKTKDIESLASLLKEIRDKEEKEIPFEFNRDGRLKVEVDKVGGGAFIDTSSLATSAKQDDIISALGGGASIPKIVTVGTYTYIGSSKVLDALTSDAVWQIIRLDTSSGLEGRYADASSDYDKVFDDYATYSY
jgi:hypothetical protein